MVHIILTGATGFLGTAVLQHILSLPASNPISKLSILSRSPVPLATNTSPPNFKRTNTTTNINVITHADYTTYPPEILSQLSDASAVIWAQGISTTAVSSAAEYRRITYDFPLAAAKALASARSADAKSPLRFIYVSGEGVTHTPGMFTQMFAKVKGEAEKALLALPQQQAYSGRLDVLCPRPGGILSNDPKEIQKMLQTKTTSMKYFMKTVLPVYRALKPGMLIDREDLGRVLVEMALREVDGRDVVRYAGMKETSCEGRVLQNVALRELGGLEKV
ncbi:uncharacterized protein AB675_700 [Cyphellophora attinorum]|uniref:NAD(P)-binding domain-containing protein n=1 Tax=Cyphellophora attinorum TaxID=1664694 RepID=A0A0N0NS99_9EURO|nr:uncharacterized protein AB675_700 [Phialophora attinorum]KPI45759.1 hypothetical protein AB675_700 [Phialophora attinorum]